MRLGNSGGKNKGKKYFIRDKATEDMITPESRKAAEDLAVWFTRDYLFLERQIKSKANGKFDIDMFHDTYLKMHEVVLYTNLKIKDYRAYFCRSYYTNLIQSAIAESRYNTPEIVIPDKSDNTNILQFEQEYSEIVSIVFTEAKAILSEHEYTLFCGFLRWKEKQKGLNGGSISDFAKSVKSPPPVSFKWHSPKQGNIFVRIWIFKNESN